VIVSHLSIDREDEEGLSMIKAFSRVFENPSARQRDKNTNASAIQTNASGVSLGRVWCRCVIAIDVR
jgi:hypothetical protein